MTLPKLSDTANDAVVLEWLCRPGDVITVGQSLLQAETNKATVDVPSPVAGTVVELLVQADEEVAVGFPLCVLETT